MLHGQAIAIQLTLHQLEQRLVSLRHFPDGISECQPCRIPHDVACRQVCTQSPLQHSASLVTCHIVEMSLPCMLFGCIGSLDSCAHHCLLLMLANAE